MNDDALAIAVAWQRARVKDNISKGASPKVSVYELFRETDSCKLKLIDVAGFKTRLCKLVKMHDLKAACVNEVTADVSQSAIAARNDGTKKKLSFDAC